LLNCLQQCDCDFICIQELQLERREEFVNDDCIARGKRSRKEDGSDDITKSTDSSSSKQPFVLPTWIHPILQTYDIILPPQSSLNKIAERNLRVLHADTAITNAILYKRNKWKPYDDCNNTKEEKSIFASNNKCATQAFIPVNEKGGDINDPIVLTSIHLDACNEEKRVQQLQQCLEHSISSSTTCYHPACIIAGDYNAELFEGSCLNAFLAKDEVVDLSSTKKAQTEDVDYSDNRVKECATSLRLSSGTLPTADQMKTWDTLHESVTTFIDDKFISLKRVDTGCTRVAYDHDEDVSLIAEKEERTMKQWHLDHIVYTPTTLLPIKRWSTLEEDELSSKVGLPNNNIPTDHLPIAALFERKPHPQLSEEAKEKLLSLLDGIESRHTIELNTHHEEAKRIRSELEHAHLEKQRKVATESNESSEQQQQSTKKKKKKVQPPPEIIQHIRNGRNEAKELKMKQKGERDSFISNLTILERMVVQNTFGRKGKVTSWIENGRLKK